MGSCDHSLAVTPQTFSCHYFSILPVNSSLSMSKEEAKGKAKQAEGEMKKTEGKIEEDIERLKRKIKK
jgi:uncharacterized protein YjbJ (UPF0337 family)